MGLEVSFLGECVAAVRADVWPFSAVLEQVLVQAVLLVESFVAGGAVKGLLPSVDPDVSLQQRPLGKLLFTVRAGVAHHPG